MKPALCTPLPNIIAPLLVVIWLAGCASTPPVDWTSRIGTYNYDQAVAELGPPDKVAKLSDGSTVAEWITYRRSRTSVGFGVGAGRYSGGYGTSSGVGVSAPVGSAQRSLRLTFGPDGLLKDWSKTNY